ncbi:MAG: type II secretion system protein M [Rhodoferax sp.]|nr:type II secretion system protein M [Rhodoferax sp.]
MTSAASLSARWARLAQRERRLVQIAIALVAGAALWWLALSPALTILRGADARHRQLDAQLQQMQALQAQAQAMQAQPKLSYDEALRALEAAVKQGLGSAGQMQVAGERATVTLKGVSPEALAQWLTQARVNARCVPREARLVRKVALSANPGAGSTANWDGTVVMSLPAR